MKKLIFSAALLTAAIATAQNTGIGTTNPNASAQLDVVASDKGILIPRVALNNTTTAAPITTPARGLQVFNTRAINDVTPGFYYWDGSKWVRLTDANSNLVGSTSIAISGNSIQRAALTGDVTSAQNSNATVISNNAVTSAKIADGTIAAADLSAMGATSGQVMKWNGTQWVAAADIDTNTTYTGSISVVANGTSFERAALTGDVTAAQNSNATVISNNAVTSAKIADGTITAGDLSNLGATAAGQNLTWNGTTWVPTTPTSANSQNIYTADGVLAGNRTVTMGNNDLSFLGNGKFGIGTTPIHKLDVLGNGNFNNGNGDTQVNIGSTAGQFAYNRFYRKIGTSQSPRWDIGLNSDSESGSDTGSNFYINSFTDTGAYKATPFIIERSTGNIGIGTVPTTRLDIAGNAKIRTLPDGSAETTFTKVLVADASGNIAAISRTDPGVPNATESIYANPKVPTDVMPSETYYSIQQNNSSRAGTYYRYTGQSITLPPGKWTIYCAYLVTGGDENGNGAEQMLSDGKSVWFRGLIDDNNVSGLKDPATLGSMNVPGTPILISTSLGQADLYQVASGVWLVDNNTGANKTYYVKVSIYPNGAFVSTDTNRVAKFSNWLEDYLFAIKRK